jgi:hypothetical protein
MRVTLTKTIAVTYLDINNTSVQAIVRAIKENNRKNKLSYDICGQEDHQY